MTPLPRRVTIVGYSDLDYTGSYGNIMDSNAIVRECQLKMHSA